MNRKYGIAAACLALCSAFCNTGLAQKTGFDNSSQLDAGFHDMYNLHFDHAHAVFEKYMAEHPKDPMGPVSNAAAYLFSEFHRTGVLDVQLFTNDQNYLKHKETPDPEIKKKLDGDLTRAQQLADLILANNPKDGRALFAETLSYGLHADYASLLERRDIQGFEFTKQGSFYAHRLLQVDPKAYDAYLAVGMENYILGLKPAPVRWLLHMAGGETDKVQGERDLELTASHGHYLRPLAKLLLAVAAIRDNDKAKARGLLSSLASEFPNNPLYAQQLAKIS
ncbi:MAG TPA: hypothetical protein VFN53_07575 [Acidobacteriaceae bacterium]|nr:hypothetical protein [Acidobacteriaceae bacterium]